MTVSSVSIEPLKAQLKGWYKVTFVSRKNGVGQTSTEMLCTDETLRQLKREIEKSLPPTNHENLAWMKED